MPAFWLPNWTVNWVDFSSRLMPHTATELASGLVAPVALAAGLITFRRALLARIKWELALLIVVLVLCLLPTANVFRWSFRWLPLFQVILALCAAESLRSFTASSVTTARRPGVFAFALIFVSVLAAWLLGVNGEHAFPFVWIILGIASAWALTEIFFSAAVRNWMPPVVTFAAFLTTYLFIPPNCGVPKYNLAQDLTKPDPLDSRRLYLSIYPAPEEAYRLEVHPEPFGTMLRPGSTSMWGGVRLINGYSPIRPSGVSREFSFAIHGEIDPSVGRSLLQQESGPGGMLARLGVDGIIVAGEVTTNPQPEMDWELAATTREGRVFHRRGEPYAAVRSLNAIDSRPNEQFASAEISRIANSRNRLEADVAAPAGIKPALLAVSRPFFEGYQAKVGDRFLKVESYRGLIPIIEIPPGLNGRLVMAYRPAWLIWGGACSVASLFVIVASAIFGALSSRRKIGAAQ